VLIQFQHSRGGTMIPSQEALDAKYEELLKLIQRKDISLYYKMKANEKPIKESK